MLKIVEIEDIILDKIWKLLKSIDQRLVDLEYLDYEITVESCHDDIQHILGLLEIIFE